MWIALVIVVLAGLMLAGCMVPAGPGIPLGASVRVPGYVATLMMTDEPHPPRLQPNQQGHEKKKLGIMLTPLDGGASSITKLGGNLDFPQHARLAVDGDAILVDRMTEGFVFHWKSGRVTRDPSREGKLPAAADLVCGIQPNPDEWLGFHTEDDVTNGKLKAGSRFWPNMYPTRGTVVEGRREARRLYRGRIDRTGVLPVIASMDAVGNQTFSSATFINETAGAGGGVVVFEGGAYPKHQVQLMRVDAAGKILWTAETGVQRETQILPGSDVIAIRGEPIRVEGKFPQPILVLVNAATGAVSTQILRW